MLRIIYNYISENRIGNILIFIFPMFIVQSCWNININNKINGIAPGSWYGFFTLNNQKVPITFRVVPNDGIGRLEFLCNKKVLVPDTSYFFGDTLNVFFNNFKNYLKLNTEIDKMEGYLYDQTDVIYPIPFYAINNGKDRFPDIGKVPMYAIDGFWMAERFGNKNDNDSLEISMMSSGNQIASTFQFGDSTSIEMEGICQDSLIYLSGFDGRNVTYFKAVFKSDMHFDKGSLMLNNSNYFIRGTKKAS